MNETTKTITLDDVMFEKYGKKEELGRDSIRVVERAFIKMFPIKYPAPLTFFAWMLPKRKKSTKEELANILIEKGLVENLSQALPIVDEMVVRKFGNDGGEYFEFETYTQKNGTLLFRTWFVPAGD